MRLERGELEYVSISREASVCLSPGNTREATTTRTLVGSGLENTTSLTTITKDTMTLKLTPLHPTFAAEVHGVDFTKPIPDDVFEEIKAAITKVRLFRVVELV